MRKLFFDEDCIRKDCQMLLGHQYITVGFTSADISRLIGRVRFILAVNEFLKNNKKYKVNVLFPGMFGQRERERERYRDREEEGENVYVCVRARVCVESKHLLRFNDLLRDCILFETRKKKKLLLSR